MTVRPPAGPRHRSPLLKLALALALLASLSACGVKGALRPLRKPLPAAPGNFSLRQMGGRFLLDWTIPRQNQDGSALTDLAGFRIYKMRYNPAEDCPDCRDTSVLFREVDLDYLQEATRRGERLDLWDTDLDVGFGYRYRVVPFTRSGFDGAPAVADRIVRPAPSAPTELAATALDHQVRLAWKPPLEISPQGSLIGYNVYRRRGDQPFPPDPVNATILQKPRFEDFSAVNDTPYHYAVRSVAVVQKQRVESALSKEVAATPQRGH